MNAAQTIAPPTPASVLTLIASIESQPPGSPAAGTFRAALRRKGFEAIECGSFAIVDTIMAEIAAANPEKADARTALLREAWPEMMPEPEWPKPATGDRP